ncbi:hypothetical protein CPB86DRAFT_460271 [Serendipita vermifera]|nr:hypothetical protein CPB86DRAFT_460271 [Serendipita vermifera]
MFCLPSASLHTSAVSERIRSGTSHKLSMYLYLALFPYGTLLTVDVSQESCSIREVPEPFPKCISPLFRRLGKRDVYSVISRPVGSSQQPFPRSRGPFSTRRVGQSVGASSKVGTIISPPQFFLPLNFTWLHKAFSLSFFRVFSLSTRNSAFALAPY